MDDEKLFFLFQKHKLILHNEIFQFLRTENMPLDRIETILNAYDGREDLLTFIKTYSTTSQIYITINSPVQLKGEVVHINPIGFIAKNEKHIVQWEDFDGLFKKMGKIEKVFELLYEKYKMHRYVILYGLVYRTVYKNLILINELESGEYLFDLNKFEFI